MFPDGTLAAFKECDLESVKQCSTVKLKDLLYDDFYYFFNDFYYGNIIIIII